MHNTKSRVSFGLMERIQGFNRSVKRHNAT